MDPNSLTPSQIKEMFGLIKAQPQKRLGQNFLIDQRIIERIIDNLNEAVPVVEIGAGLGALTFPIAQKVKQIVAWEIDPQIFRLLQQRNETQDPRPNLQLINADFLKKQNEELMPQQFAVVGSLPYRSSAAIIHKLITELYEQWAQAWFILQKEVVGKMVQGPPRASYWFHALNPWYDVQVQISRIAPSSFWPPPQVDSALIEISRKEAVDPKRIEEIRPWLEFIQRLFQFPRKQIKAVIPVEMIPESIDIHKRPGALTNSEVEELFQSMKEPLQRDDRHQTKAKREVIQNIRN